MKNILNQSIKNNCKLIVLIIVSISILSCNNHKNSATLEKQDTIDTTNKDIQWISVLYYNYVFKSDSPIKLQDIKIKIPNFEVEHKGILDATIKDSIKIRKIETLLNLLEDSDIKAPLDARIVAIINRNNGTKDTLSIGGEYSNQIYLNGIEKKPNNELLYLIKNIIGFYPWMIGDDMFDMTEMKDNSFPKEPFISSKYYRDYQKVLTKNK